jgi:hypothetical protein
MGSSLSRHDFVAGLLSLVGCAAVAGREAATVFLAPLSATLFKRPQRSRCAPGCFSPLDTFPTFIMEQLEKPISHSRLGGTHAQATCERSRQRRPASSWISLHLASGQHPFLKAPVPGSDTS